MPGPKPPTVDLSEAAQAEVEKLVNQHTVAQQIAFTGPVGGLRRSFVVDVTHHAPRLPTPPTETPRESTAPTHRRPLR